MVRACWGELQRACSGSTGTTMMRRYKTDAFAPFQCTMVRPLVTLATVQFMMVRGGVARHSVTFALGGVETDRPACVINTTAPQDPHHARCCVRRGPARMAIDSAQYANMPHATHTDTHTHTRASNPPTHAHTHTHTHIHTYTHRRAHTHIHTQARAWAFLAARLGVAVFVGIRNEIASGRLRGWSQNPLGSTWVN